MRSGSRGGKSEDRRHGGTAVSPGAADWLSLAAAPTLAMMALLAATQGGDPATIICSAAHGGSPFTGMIPMYLLMSVFHAQPWLRLVGARLSR